MSKANKKVIATIHPNKRKNPKNKFVKYSICIGVLLLSILFSYLQGKRIYV